MSSKPRPQRPRHKPRPRPRPRLFSPSPLPLPQTNLHAQWSPQQMTLEEMLLDLQLPQVVQCRTPVLRGRDDGPPPVRLDMPMILAEMRSARHLLARIVVFDKPSSAFNESTDSVVIPEDYEGNFLRLHSRTTKDKTHVQSLKDIAQDDTPAFLNLAKLTTVPAGPRNPRDKSKLIYTIGNVFLVDEPLPEGFSNGGHSNTNGSSTRAPGGGGGGGGGHSASSGGGSSSRDKSATTSTTKSSSSGRSANGMMRCLDEDGRAVMVPTNQVGEMVRVQTSGGQSRLSVKSSDMIANEQFPLLARYAYSKRHPRLTGFSRLFTLLDSFQETSIVACTIDGPSVMLMEIPVTSSLQFQVALNRDDILKIPRMRNALDACRKQGRELARDIKYKYKFSHRVQETSRRMMKLREDDMPSATVRTRLLITEGFVYI